MSNNDVSNVTTGKPMVGGAIFRAATGTQLPVNATSSLSSAYKNLGFVSEDGLTNENTADSEEIKAWGGQTVLVTQSSKSDTFKFTLLEVLNEEVLKTVYGSDNVTGTLATGITVTANAKEAEESTFVIDMVLRDNAIKRIVIPCGKVSEVGEITYTDEDAVGYETTLKCMPDSSGNTHYEYIVRSSGSGSN